MPTLFFATFFEDERQASPLCEFFYKTFTSHPVSGWSMAENSDSADVVLFVDGSWGAEYRALRRHPLVCSRRKNVFLFDETDRPIPFLPGLYVSLPRRKFDPDRHQAFHYVYSGNIIRNPMVESCSERQVKFEPEFLMSFMGRSTCKIRKLLLENPWKRKDCPIIEAKNYNHWDEAKDESRSESQKNYVDLINRSKFSLCPRGAGTASIRLFEVMRLSRCPVILSDDYVFPPELVEGTNCVRVEEKRWRDLPEILEKIAGQSEQLGRNARITWENNFSQSTLAKSITQKLELLLKRTVHSREMGYRQRCWHFSVAWNKSLRLARGMKVFLRNLLKKK